MFGDMRDLMVADEIPGAAQLRGFTGSGRYAEDPQMQLDYARASLAQQKKALSDLKTPRG